MKCAERTELGPNQTGLHTIKSVPPRQTSTGSCPTRNIIQRLSATPKILLHKNFRKYGVYFSANAIFVHLLCITSYVACVYIIIIIMFL